MLFSQNFCQKSVRVRCQLEFTAIINRIRLFRTFCTIRASIISAKIIEFFDYFDFYAKTSFFREIDSKTCKLEAIIAWNRHIDGILINFLREIDWNSPKNALYKLSLVISIIGSWYFQSNRRQIWKRFSIWWIFCWLRKFVKLNSKFQILFTFCYIFLL